MMTYKEKLKASISEDFNSKNYEDAFDSLFSLSTHEVAGLVNKNKWLNKSEISNYFWNSYLLKEHSTVFGGVQTEVVFGWYLKNPKHKNDELNEFFVKDYPSEFITSIRRNRSFLDNDFLNRILNCDWSPQHSVHLLAWKELHENHTGKQAAIDKAWGLIDELDLNKVLTGLIYWIDSRFFKDFDDVNHEKLRWVYNYALSYVLSKQKSIETIKEEEFDKLFIKTTQSEKYNRINFFLNKIGEWIEFESTVLSSYCFDDNFQPKMINGHLSFEFISKEKYESWVKDTNRYLVNAKRYYADAIKIYHVQDKAGDLNIPSGRSKMDKNINHALYIKNWQSFRFLEDLSIRNLIFKGRSIHFSKFLNGLSSFSMNRQFRYVEPMNIYMQQGANWMQAYKNNLKQSIKSGVSNTPKPYMYITNKELIDIYKNAMPELENTEIEDLINHFSYTLQSGAKFNPFIVKYSVIETPFLKLGDYVLTSTSFFASNEWFYSVAQRALYRYANKSHTYERNETANQMEKGLGEEFEKHGWKVKVISPNETDSIDGDIDLFVNDGETQLLIQLKRTKFKLDLAANYKDTLETDLKAYGQLNEAVSSLKSKPVPDMEILNTHEKWIVTTSFEGVLTELDDCRKVNHFDLLWALRNKEFTSLNELKIYIEKDGPYRDCMHYLKALN